MPVDVTGVLRKALGELEAQKSRLDRQIIALHAVLDGDSPVARTMRSASSRKRRMSAAARRAVGVRMKAYWAKRREASTKASPTTRKSKRTRSASQKKK
jgi:hypothetical protein